MAPTNGIGNDEGWTPAGLGWTDDLLMPELGDEASVAVSAESMHTSASVSGGDDKAGEEEQKPLTEEEQKRLRNRASVEKCRRKKRLRLESLNREHVALTRENKLLRATANNARNSMIQILREVASLSIEGIETGTI